MPCDYQAERPKIFTEDGQVLFLKIRDHAQQIMKASGAASMEAVAAQHRIFVLPHGGA